MRRHSLYLLVLLFGGVLLPAVVWSQPDGGQPDGGDEPAVVSLSEAEPVPVTLTPISEANVRSSMAAPGNSCDLATAVSFTYPFDLLATGSHSVNDYAQDINDPTLSCLANTVFDTQGFRSAWYVVTPPVSGFLQVRTVTDAEYRRNYDTVIAIHGGSCGSLTELACNDDSYALLSSATTPVQQGQTYYIEVAAYSQGVGALPPTLNIEADIVPNQEWGEAANTLPTPLTGHAVVIQDKYAYIIGGLTDLFSPFWTGGNRSGATYRYDTSTGELVELARMPAGGGSGAFGYAWADAVLVNDEIHMPTGFVGTNGNYDGTHWVYNITDNIWRIFAASQGQIDPPWGPAPGTNVPGWAAMANHRLGDERGFFVTGGLTGPFRGGSSANPVATTYQYVDENGVLVWNTLPDMLTARYAHTAVRLPDGASYRICVVGGLTVDGGGDAILEGGECYFPNGTAPDFIPGWEETVGPLNIPRYMAESVVGPDGRWYVLGGIDRNGNYVAETEVFDANTGTWAISDANRSLAAPPLAWTRGGFVGNRLWLFGGQQPGGPVPVPIIQSNLFADNLGDFPNNVYMPFMWGGVDRRTSFLLAQTIELGVPVREVFDILGDAYHIFAVDVSGEGILTVRLNNIPQGYNYDIQLYDDEKRLWNSSTNIGVNPERIDQRIDNNTNDSGSIPPGLHYIFVIRNAPNVPPSPSPYELVVTFQPD